MVTLDGVEMIDVKEAATLVGRTPETVRRWVWAHRISAVKHGNRLLISRRDLVRLARGDDEVTKPEQGLSLREWGARMARTNTAGNPGTTARDLVLEDRASRRARNLDAGR